MKTRSEIVITIDKTWAGGEEDIILPDEVTDFMVTDYDTSETLYIVKGGLLYEYDDGKFVKCGLMKNELKNILKEQ